MAKADRRRERRRDDEIDRGPLGTVLKRKRDELGHSQEWVAEQTGIPLTSYSKIERGIIRYPSVERIRSIARALNLDADMLLVEGGIFRAPTAANRLLQKLDPEEAVRLHDIHGQIDDMLVKLHPEEVTALVQHLRTLERISEARRRAGSPPASLPGSQEKTAPDGAGR